MDLASLGQKLNTLKRVSNDTGVVAQAYFAKGTSEDVLLVARKQLGKGNVFLFDDIE